MTTPFDYDRNPERFRLATEVTQQYLRVARSLYSHLAELLAGVGARRILDVGCGEGALRAALPAQLQSRVVGLDASWTMLGAHPRPVVQAHAAALPFPAAVFDAAVAVNVFDHLHEPAGAIAEAHRVLVAGGLLVAATASRHDSPELAEVWRPPPSSFDAEDAPGLIAAASRRSRSSAGMRRWSGCPTATRSATTSSRGSCRPRSPPTPPGRSPNRRPSPSEARWSWLAKRKVAPSTSEDPEGEPPGPGTTGRRTLGPTAGVGLAEAGLGQVAERRGDLGDRPAAVPLVLVQLGGERGEEHVDQGVQPARVVDVLATV